MTTIERTVTTTAPPEKVFDFLLDFRNATVWDSGTKSCELVSGDGGPGTVYRNVSAFAGNEVELDYTVEAVDSPTSFTIVGRNDTTTSHDTVTVTPHAAGSTVVYRADFSFSGVARLAGPLMKPLLNRLGDKTAEQLKTSLDRL